MITVCYKELLLVFEETDAKVEQIFELDRIAHIWICQQRSNGKSRREIIKNSRDFCKESQSLAPNHPRQQLVQQAFILNMCVLQRMRATNDEDIFIKFDNH